MKSIYQYRNYREILKDIYLAEKKKSPRFTYAQFARKTGLRSPNYLKLVIDGARNLTPTNIHAFAKSLNLGGEELNYFEALVMENQSKSAMEKRYYSRRISDLRARRKGTEETNFTRKSPSSIMDSVLKMSLLLLAKGETSEQLIEAVSTELEIHPKEIREALKQLIDAKELLVDHQNSLSRSSSHTMMNDPKGINEWQKKFLGNGLKESHLIFSDRYPFGNAKFLSLLVSAPEGSLNDLFADLRAAFETIVQKYDPLPDQKKGIYRVQFQTYRLKKKDD